MRIVHDEGEFIALWFPMGTRWKAPTTPAGRPKAASRGERLATCLAQGEWSFVDAAWDVTTLCLMRAGEWHATWVSWLESGEHWGWYVNLQQPYRRTDCGFATMDLALDVIIDADRSWRWKDADELETFVARGVFEPALSDCLYAEGLRVVRRALRGEAPFGEPWPTWCADPAWPLPELPSGWDEPCRSR